MDGADAFEYWIPQPILLFILASHVFVKIVPVMLDDEITHFGLVCKELEHIYHLGQTHCRGSGSDGLTKYPHSVGGC
jgi:hypothetical protein